VFPSLADAARRNGGRDVHLFETGRVFTPEERRTVGLLSQGDLFTPHRANEGVPKADFYSVKGVIDALCPGLTWGIPATPDPRLHPTRQAEVVGLGILGVLHPDTAEACGLPADTVVAEFDLEQLAASLMAPIAYRPISRNPAVRRDLAILIDKSVPFADVLGAIEQAGLEKIVAQFGHCLQALFLLQPFTLDQVLMHADGAVCLAATAEEVA